MCFKNLRDDLIVLSGLLPTLQKAECVNIPDMTLHLGMNYAIVITRVKGDYLCKYRLHGLFSPDNHGKTMGISGKQKKSEKSAFLGWTASEVPLINRAHHPAGGNKPVG